MMKTFLFPFIRQGAAGFAGYLVGNGFADAATANELAVGLMGAITIGWSIFEKVQAKKKVA
jgi:hypothetical protein